MQRLTGMLVLVGLIAALVLAAAPASVSEAKGAFPSIINLPNGWRPEGIAIGRGTNFYAGSLANGAIYRGDLRTGEGDILVPGVTGRAIAGLYVDDRSNKLFAAGTQSGQAFVFDARTGATLATYQLAATFPSFINDVVVTRDAAYFTDSFQAMLYRVPLGPKGALPDQSAVQRIPLSGDFVQVPGPFVFNSNGIEASSNGKSLLIVNSTRGELYRVDPQTGNATQGQSGWRQSERWRWPAFAGTHLVCRAQPTESDCRRTVGIRFYQRRHRGHDYGSQLRRAHHDRPLWLVAVCGQCALQHAAYAGYHLHRGARLAQAVTPATGQLCRSGLRLIGKHSAAIRIHRIAALL